jgi:hypothetical protein
MRENRASVSEAGQQPGNLKWGPSYSQCFANQTTPELSLENSRVSASRHLTRKFKLSIANLNVFHMQV